MISSFLVFIANQDINKTQCIYYVVNMKRMVKKLAKMWQSGLTLTRTAANVNLILGRFAEKYL
jgi:hypothetical protein